MDLLTAQELAAHLKVKVSAVRSWQLQGIPYVPVGRLPRYRLEDVLAWLRTRANQKQAEKTARKEDCL